MHEVVHSVAVAEGTAAPSAMDLALGTGPGYEVIVPSLTFISSATTFLYVVMTPTFTKIRPDTFNPVSEDAAAWITASAST
jgi:perosamine synthetase